LKEVRQRKLIGDCIVTVEFVMLTEEASSGSCIAAFHDEKDLSLSLKITSVL
jgi:hypothetical protein